METLIIIRSWKSAYNQTSTLKTLDGKLKAVITSPNKQPKKNSKTITLKQNGKNIEYLLDWSKINSYI